MRALIICLSLACLAGAAPAWANGHAAQPAAVPSAHFQADAALTEHMSHVGAAVDALQHYEHGHMDQAQGAAPARQARERQMINARIGVALAVDLRAP